MHPRHAPSPLLVLSLATLALPAAGQARRLQQPPVTSPAHCLEGHWEDPFNHDTTGFTVQPLANRFNAVHMSLIPVGPHRGKLLVWDFEDRPPDEVGDERGAWLQRWSIVGVPPMDGPPQPPTFRNFDLQLPACKGDLFCAGHTWDTQGRLFVAGGTTGYGAYPNGMVPPGLGGTWVGNNAQPVPCHPKVPLEIGGRLSYYWDPLGGPNGKWTQMPSVERSRWYPSVTLLPDGRLLVSGGGSTPNVLGYDNSYEVFDPATGQYEDNGGTQVFPGPAYPDGRDPLMLYPRLHLLTTGELFLGSITGWSARLNHAVAPGVWEVMGFSSHGIDYRIYNNSVLLPDAYDGPDQVMILGGNAIIGAPPNPIMVLGATETAEQCWAGAPSAAGWQWQQRDSMEFPREYSCTVTLPDSSLLVSAGTEELPNWTPGGRYVMNLETYSPKTRQWRTIVDPHAEETSDARHSGHEFRGYHQTAMLLPDGRVMIAGGNVRASDYHVYRPWYLTCGKPRPVITALPTQLGFGETFTIKHDEMPAPWKVDRAILMAPGSTTHHFDFAARLIDLAEVSSTPRSITVTAPPDANHAPPGYYMVFLLSDGDVPSHAGWVKLQ